MVFCFLRVFQIQQPWRQSACFSCKQSECYPSKITIFTLILALKVNKAEKSISSEKASMSEQPSRLFTVGFADCLGQRVTAFGLIILYFAVFVLSPPSAHYISAMRQSQEAVLIGPYAKLRRLGQSTSGDVFLAEEGSGGPQWAVKVIAKQMLAQNEGFMEALQAEVACMRQLDEPHVVRLKQFLEDADHFYMVLEYCDAGDIVGLQAKRSNRAFRLRSAAELLSQLLLSMESLHSRGFMHGEINLQNVLLKSEGGRQVLKLRFDGFTKLTLKLKAETSAYVQYFRAPEVFLANLRGQPPSECPGREIDVWAFGVLFFFMLNAEFPFRLNPHSDWKRWYEDLRRLAAKFSYRNAVGKTQKRITENCTDSVEDLFRRVFQADPKKRITALQLRRHPIFAPYFRPPSYLIERILFHPIRKRVVPTFQSERASEKEGRSLGLDLEEVAFLAGIAQQMELAEQELGPAPFLMLSYSLCSYSTVLLNRLCALGQANRQRKGTALGQEGLYSKTPPNSKSGEFEKLLERTEQRLKEVQEPCRKHYLEICRLNGHFSAVFGDKTTDCDPGMPFFRCYRRSTAVVYSVLKKRLMLNVTPRLCFLLCSVCIAHSFSRLLASEDLKRTVFAAFLEEVTDTVLHDRVSYKRVGDYLRRCDSERLLKLAKKIIDDTV